MSTADYLDDPCPADRMPAPRCRSTSTATGHYNRCILDEGHAGQHETGGPYDVEGAERWGGAPPSAPARPRAEVARLTATLADVTEQRDRWAQRYKDAALALDAARDQARAERTAHAATRADRDEVRRLAVALLDALPRCETCQTQMATLITDDAPPRDICDACADAAGIRGECDPIRWAAPAARLATPPAPSPPAVEALPTEGEPLPCVCHYAVPCPATLPAPAAPPVDPAAVPAPDVAGLAEVEASHADQRKHALQAFEATDEQLRVVSEQLHRVTEAAARVNGTARGSVAHKIALDSLAALMVALEAASPLSRSGGG